MPCSAVCCGYNWVKASMFSPNYSSVGQSLSQPRHTVPPHTLNLMENVDINQVSHLVCALHSISRLLHLWHSLRSIPIHPAARQTFPVYGHRDNRWVRCCVETPHFLCVEYLKTVPEWLKNQCGEIPPKRLSHSPLDPLLIWSRAESEYLDVFVVSVGLRKKRKLFKVTQHEKCVVSCVVCVYHIAVAANHGFFNLVTQFFLGSLKFTWHPQSELRSCHVKLSMAGFLFLLKRA